ncbi:MAG: Na/Pi cotransporter family protein, partial [Erysipelotrichaceae bacterium]|nr:Na/Pi cotransporter family protein [Erysipelotrichaceae bacterium]
MDIYSALQIMAGLAFFLYGMNVMSSSLEKMAGGSLELTLKKVTSNKLLSFLLGAIITVAIQSSSGVMV